MVLMVWVEKKLGKPTFFKPNPGSRILLSNVGANPSHTMVVHGLDSKKIGQTTCFKLNPSLSWIFPRKSQIRPKFHSKIPRKSIPNHCSAWNLIRVSIFIINPWVYVCSFQLVVSPVNILEIRYSRALIPNMFKMLKSHYISASSRNQIRSPFITWWQINDSMQKKSVMNHVKFR